MPIRRFSNRKSNSSDDSSSSGKKPVSPKQDKARIEELEAQVKELSGLVELLIDDTKEPNKKNPDSRPEKAPGQMELSTSLAPQALVDGVKDGVEKILGVQKGETIETRIGSTWLPRVAVLLFMTVLILGMRDDSVQPFYKVLIGYGIGILLGGYGIYRRQMQGLFPKAMQGVGLATIFYASYAVFYVPEMDLLHGTKSALPVTAATLVFIGWGLWLGRSQFATMIVLLLAQYTIIQSLNGEITEGQLKYALVIWGIMAFITAVLQLRGRWKWVLWLALVCTYGGYAYYFSYAPEYWNIEFKGAIIQQEAYLPFANMFLSGLCILFAMGTMACARKHTSSGPGMVLFSLANCFLFVYANQYAFRTIPNQAEIAFGIMGVVCIVLAYCSRPKFAPNNVIMQVLVCQAILWGGMYLHFALSVAWEPISLSFMCLGLALIYKRLPLSVLTALQFLLMIAVFAGSMGMVQIPGDTLIASFALPTKWVFTCSLVLIFTAIAWYYDHRVAPHSASLAQPEGRWILGNQRWNWSPNVIAVFYATTAAFIMSALTIYDLGNDTRLPFILAGQALAFALIGLILRTPQMELSGVLILVTAHVTFHFYGYMDVNDFTSQPYFIEAALGIALVSYLGSYFWERYIRHIEDGTDWEHNLLSSIPFVASTLILTSVFEHIINSPLGALSQTLLGLTLMAVGMLNRLIGLRIAAVTAVGLGSISFYIRSLDINAPNTNFDHFFVIVMGIVLSIAATERILYHWESKTETTSKVTPGFHVALVLISVSFGTLGLWHGSPADKLSLYMMAWALGVLVFGVLFRSSYYRFAALFLIFAVFVRLYMHDLSNLDPLLKILVFAVFTGVIFMISWGYSRIRSK